MASLSTLCLGCGSNIAHQKGTRLINTPASSHVLPLWTALVTEEISQRSTSATAQSLVENIKRMCRQCFNTFERASKLWQTLKANMVKAGNAYIPRYAPPVAIDRPCEVPPTPKRPRLSDWQEEQSPKVKVSIISGTQSNFYPFV